MMLFYTDPDQNPTLIYLLTDQDLDPDPAI